MIENITLKKKEEDDINDIHAAYRMENKYHTLLGQNQHA